MCLLLLLVITRLDVVEAELVDVLRGGDDTGRHVSPNVHTVKVEKLGVPNPVTEGVLLEELFGEVFEVPLGKRDARGHGDLVGAIAGDLDALSKLPDLALDLDAIVQVLFEGCAIEDTVASGARVVNDELVLRSSLRGGLWLHEGIRQNETQHEPTEKITQQSGTGTNHLDGSDGGNVERERGVLGWAVGGIACPGIRLQCTRLAHVNGPIQLLSQLRTLGTSRC